MHDVGIDQAQCLMPKGFGYGSYDREAHFLPERDSAFVCGDDEVELHGEKTEVSGGLQGVFTELPPDSFSAFLASHHVAGIADMGSETWLICLDIVGPQNFVAQERYVAVFVALGP